MDQSLDIDMVFIHDYGSTDSSRSKIEKLSKEYIHLSFQFFEYAKSACHSFLNSIAIIRDNYLDSEYILYLCDQDDVWVHTKNEIVFEELQNGAKFIFHDVVIVNSDLETIKPSFYNKFWDVQRDFSLPSLFLSNCVIGHTIALSSTFLKNLNLEFDERIPMHDWYLSLLVLSNDVPYKFIPKQLSYYRQHSNNVLGASQSNPILKIKKSYNHGRILLFFQKFLLSRGFDTTENLARLFRYSLNLRPYNKLGFIFLTLIFSFCYKISNRKNR
jgi:rhamnosyltransferase